MSTSSNPPMVLLTSESGQPVLVNLDHVIATTISRGATTLRLTEGKTLDVQEKPDEILPLLVKQHMEVTMTAMETSGSKLAAMFEMFSSMGREGEPR